MNSSGPSPLYTHPTPAGKGLHKAGVGPGGGSVGHSSLGSVHGKTGGGATSKSTPTPPTPGQFILNRTQASPVPGAVPGSILGAVPNSLLAGGRSGGLLNSMVDKAASSTHPLNTKNNPTASSTSNHHTANSNIRQRKRVNSSPRSRLLSSHTFTSHFSTHNVLLLFTTD